MEPATARERPDRLDDPSARGLDGGNVSVEILDLNHRQGRGRAFRRIGLDADVREWFGPRPGKSAGTGRKHGRRGVRGVPATTVPPNLIERFLG